MSAISGVRMADSLQLYRMSLLSRLSARQLLPDASEGADFCVLKLSCSETRQSGHLSVLLMKTEALLSRRNVIHEYLLDEFRGSCSQAVPAQWYVSHVASQEYP